MLLPILRSKQRESLRSVTSIVKVLYRYYKIPLNSDSLVAKADQEGGSTDNLVILSGILRNMNIDHFVVKTTYQKLSRINLPAIVQINDRKNEFVLLTDLSESSVAYVDYRHVEHTILKPFFINLWTGSLLVIEQDTNSWKVGADRKQTLLPRINIVSVALILLILCSIVFLSSETLLFKNLLLCKVIGLFLCSVILFRTDSGSSLLNAFCVTSKHVNCDKILRSPVSSVFQWLSVAEVGSYYFLSTFLLIVFSIIGDTELAMTSLVLLANVLSLPFTVFFVGYQIVRRTWCILCLAVHLTIWLEFLILYPLLSTSFILGNYPYTVLLWSFLLPICLWLIIKPLTKRSRINESISQELSSIKKDPKIFRALLDGTDSSIDMNPFPMEVAIGKEDNMHAILILSFSCSVCLEAFEKTLEFAKDSGKKLIVRFVVPSQEDEGYLMLVWLFSHMLFDSSMKNEDIILFCYRNRGVMNGEHMKLINSLTLDQRREVERLIRYHKSWIQSVFGDHIYTPMIVINGKVIPKIYTFDNVLSHMKSLDEYERV